MKLITNGLLAASIFGLLLLFTGCPSSGDDPATTDGDETGGAATTGTTTAAAGGNAAAGAWTGDAMDFSYTSFAGASGNASDYAGTPLVVNFWAAW